VITGIAFGVISGTLADIALGQVPAQLAASASGVVNTITELGSVLAITITGAIFFDTLGSHPHQDTFTNATTNSLWYLAVSCAAAAIACGLLPGRRSTRLIAPAHGGALPKHHQAGTSG